MQKSLSELLKPGEGENLDFKQKVTSLFKIAKTICSFANTHGGTLLIGVKDDRTITGIDPEEEKFMLEQAASQYCQPEIPLQFEEIEEEEDFIVLKVTIEESPLKPHSSLNKEGGWQVYIRQYDKSLPAGKSMVRHLRQVSSGTSASAEQVPDKKETKILDFLIINGRITVKDLEERHNFSNRGARRILTQMVQKGFLRLFEHEKEDYYA